MTAPRFGDEANRQAIDDNIYRNDSAGYTSGYPQIPEFISQKLQPLVNTIDHQMVNLDHAATGVAHSSLMNNMMSFDQWFYNTTEPGVRVVYDLIKTYGPPLGPTVQTLGGVAGLAGAILGTAASGPFSWATALSLGGIAGASIDQIETGLYGVYKGYSQPSNLRTASGLVGFSETSQDRIEFARDLASGGKEALTKGIHLFGLMKPSTLKLAGKGAGNAARTVRFTELASGATKAEVRAMLKSGELNLPIEQTNKINKLLRGGTMEQINIKLTQSGNVRVSTERAGRTSGYQRMSFEVDQAGNTNKIVQTAFDDTNTLVRQMPGESKNNLYDVKRWKR